MDIETNRTRQKVSYQEESSPEPQIYEDLKNVNLQILWEEEEKDSDEAHQEESHQDCA